MNGDFDVEKIFGLIIAVILIFSVVIPVLTITANSLTGQDEKQKTIDRQQETIAELEQSNLQKQNEIDRLSTLIQSLNSTVGDNENTIANLSAEISLLQKEKENISNELSYYKEKEYIQEINNQYYNISNYFEKIENKFFPIEISISIISLALLSVIVKVFNLHLLIKRLFKRKKNKKKEEETNKKLPLLD